MKIVCPFCDATYEVPEKLVTSRRKMRCARCAAEWVPGDGAAPVADPLPVFVAPPEASPPAAAMMQAAVAPAEPGALPHEAQVAQEAPDWGAIVPETAAEMPEQRPLAADPEPVMDLPLTALVVVPPRPVTLAGGTAGQPAPVQATPFTQRMVPPAEDRSAPLLAWTGSVALVIAAVAAALMFRVPVMKIWPPSTRLYAAIGMNHP